MVLPTMIFAQDLEYTVTYNIVTSILNAFSWFAYAIALGVLIWMGIKYVTSGASERADVKSNLSKYLIGVGLIVLCATIASIVVGFLGIAGKSDEKDVVQKGFEVADLGYVKDPTKIISKETVSFGGNAENPYQYETTTKYEDGSYDIESGGNGRNTPNVVREYNKNKQLERETYYNEDGSVASEKVYNVADGSYNEIQYNKTPLSLNDVLTGQVMDSLRTQENGYRLTATTMDTNGDGKDDKVYYTDIDGTVKGEGDITYDAQGRITKINRGIYKEDGKDGYSSEVANKITYNSDGTVIVENEDEKAVMNRQQYKYEIDVNNYGNVSSITYSEYVTKWGWLNDEYEKAYTTKYDVD